MEEAAARAESEYGALEIASLLPAEVRADLSAQIAGMQDYLPRFLALHRDLASRHRIHLLTARSPVRAEDGPVSQPFAFVRSGRPHRVSGQAPDDAFERESWQIAGGRGLRVFETSLGRIGVAVCDDAEFPLPVRQLVEAGAELILVPSCTDGLAGYHRCA